MLNFILNLLWFIFGGLISGLAWVFAGVIAALSIIGLPWARACFMLASFSFWPFGRDVVSRRDLYGREDLGTGDLGTLGNLVWVLLFGWWLAVMHLIAAAGLAITIIGLPFAFQHLKLALASLFPIGKVVVPIEIARSTRGMSDGPLTIDGRIV